MATSTNTNNQNIHVEQKSVKALLSSENGIKFIIPEYQRPYSWTDEQIETLFNDLLDFTEKDDPTYFLGCIVSCANGNTLEIIDGQQRITSLFLLLRAIYTHLQKPELKAKEAKNFIRQIESIIWKQNELTGEVDDFGDILLESKVINNAGNEILRNILKTGDADDNAKDNYSLNYRKFQQLYSNVSKDNPLHIYQFIKKILSNVILLLITADTQPTALTIFSTLNNRGLPLSDADIFKATIYNHLEDNQRKNFISKWKDLEESAQDTDESIQSLFYYYMFYLRGKEGDTSSTTPGIRKYFMGGHKSNLYDSELLDKLENILNLWNFVKNRIKNDEEWTDNIEILKALDILSSYPNEFWKYPVVSFYLAHKAEDGFENNFKLFLNRLTAELVMKYVLVPSVNAVKVDIMKLNASVIKSMKPVFEFKEIENKSQLDELIKKPNTKSVRMLLKILAYEYQNELLPVKWEIEHIFPQKWHSNYFENVSDEVIAEKIEYLGNKIPFEKKLNIQAGNGYFGEKQKKYKKSKIAIVKALAENIYADWKLKDIEKRGVTICEKIKSVLNTWVSSYSSDNR